MLSIICPVYNEADNIEKVFDEIFKKISTSAEIVVIYDHERDNTIPVVKKIANNYPFTIRLAKNHFGNGALNAIKTGFREANYGAVLVTMADLSDDLSIVDQMYSLISEQGMDVVCGSRYMPGGKQIGGPFLKKFLSRMAGISLYYLAKIPTHDVTNSFKMYRRDLLQSVKIESKGGFEIGMELVVKAFLEKRKIAELPTIWIDRTAGESRFQMWNWMPSYLRWYFYAFKVKRDTS